MTCLKCGKELKEQAVFCKHCLELMEAYPVKSDVHIQLPNRTETNETKRVWFKRRKRSATEQRKHLRRVNQWLTVAVIVLSLLLVIVSAHLARTTLHQQDTNIGKNYTYENTRP